MDYLQIPVLHLSPSSHFMILWSELLVFENAFLLKEMSEFCYKISNN